MAESPSPPLTDGEDRLYVVIPNVLCDLDAFFAFYDKDKPEPWGVVVFTNGHYNLRFKDSEIERWAYFEELMELKKER